jgi:membrane associated rhomboid family serine protease
MLPLRPFQRSAPRAPWPDLAPLVDGRPAGRLSQAQARLWSLVLRARRVPHRLRSLPGGYTLQVPTRFVAQAVDEITLYHRENISPHPSIPLPPPEERSRATVAAMLALCAFFVATHRPWPELGSYPQYWHSVGAGDAARMLGGQWWRMFTALTLHADPAHMASNAVIGGAFLILLARRIGSGGAWLLAVLAGGLGNVLNVLAHGPAHLSVGFSTAVFGAAGALAGLKAVSGEADLAQARFQTGPRGWLLPVAAALALLASLGTAGENTDIGAHFFGLVSGGLLGLAAGLLAVRHGYPGSSGDANRGGDRNLWLDRLFGWLAALLLAGAWAWGWLLGWPVTNG